MTMNKFTYTGLLLIFLAFCLDACGDDYRAEDSDFPTIKQNIFVVPENASSKVYQHYVPKTNNIAEVNVNEKIKFVAAYSIDGSYTEATDYAADNFKLKWTLKNDVSHNMAFSYTFSEAGIYTAYLETTDLNGDSMKDSVEVYVNTHVSIALKNPPNKYNLVDPKNDDGLELQWEANGIDPWEDSYCTLYISEDRNSVWDTPLGNLACDQGATLMGSFIPSATKSTDTSLTFYWGMTINTTSNAGGYDQDTSKIFKFTTKFTRDFNPILTIPIVLKSFNNKFPIKTEIKIINSAGRVLSTLYNSNPQAVFSQRFPSQSKLKIVACEISMTEYGCDSTTVELLPKTTTIIDTIYLQDRTRPGFTPFKTRISKKDSIQFYALDKGSGINPSTVAVQLNQEQQKFIQDSLLVSFKNTCKGTCELALYAEDFAKNKSADIYWTVTTEKDSAFIEGPFSRLGER